MDLRGTGCKGVHWFQKAQDRVQSRDFLKEMKKFWAS